MIQMQSILIVADNSGAKKLRCISILGGSKGSEADMLGDIHDALAAGAAGVAIGRNVFQCENPTAMTAAIVAIVHDDASVDQALTVLDS